MSNYEQQALDEEREQAERVEQVARHDARSNLAAIAGRHAGIIYSTADRSLYYRTFDQEVADLVREQERQVLEPISLETQELIRQSIVGLGLSQAQQRLPSQRYRVRHMSSQDCELNPEDGGYATYEGAALRRDELLEDGSLMYGDYVTIEDQGCTIELHECHRK